MSLGIERWENFKNLLTSNRLKCKAKAKRFANGVNKFWWIRDRCFWRRRPKQTAFLLSKQKATYMNREQQKMFSVDDKHDAKIGNGFRFLLSTFEGVEAPPIAMFAVHFVNLSQSETLQHLFSFATNFRMKFELVAWYFFAKVPTHTLLEGMFRRNSAIGF